MTTSKNPNVDGPQATPCEAGGLKFNRHVFDFAASYAPAAVVTGALIQIGVVPAGNKLVPHLSRIAIPALDTNGAPTGDYTVGSADDPDALKAAAAAETAVVLSGEDFTVVTSELGALAEDVPVYITATGDFATVAATGKVFADLVIRPFDSNAGDTDLT
jgi:hypothetical protein